MERKILTTELKRLVVENLPIYEQAVNEFWSDIDGVIKSDLAIFFCAQGIAESNLRMNAVSRVGAKGIMQLMKPAVADIMRFHGNHFLEDLIWTKPIDNIRAGVCYDRICYKYLRFHCREIFEENQHYLDWLDWIFAVYNWGIGSVDKHLENYEITEMKYWLFEAPEPDGFADETEKYILRIHQAHSEILKEGFEHG